MKILLVTLRKRAGSDDVSRRETLHEGQHIRVGRGVAMEINLPDIDVDFHHATLTDAGGYLSMRSVGEGGLSVGKATQNEAGLQPGVEVKIARYTFKGEPGREGADHVVVMEEEPDTGASHHDRRGSKRRLDEVLPSRRLLGWVFSLAIFGVFMAWPMAEVLTRSAPLEEAHVVDGMARTEAPKPAVMEAAWSSGPVSRSHSMIEDDCGACHQRPFEMTTNGACLACHADTSNHADIEAHPAVALENTRCASCHKEHNGGETPTDIANTACATCHANIKIVSEKTRLNNITSFAADHPAFQLALIINAEEDAQGNLIPKIERTPFDPKNPPSEGSGLVFPHAKHLSPEGVKTGNGTRVLVCADCHRAQAGGRLMQPMVMERDCGGCHAHKLTFDAGGIERDLPHADAGETERILRDYFVAAAMAGEIILEDVPEDEAQGQEGANTGSGEQTEAQQPRRKRKRRQIAGQANPETKLADLTANDREATVEWAAQEARQRIDTVFKTQLCGKCHETQQLQTQNLAQRWRVKPAFVQHHWMPKAEFNHGPHDAMDCTHCHTGANNSKLASDVLMPGLETCQSCHSAENAAGAASSACVDCHDYHIPGRAPMSPEHAKVLQDRAHARQMASSPQQ